MNRRQFLQTSIKASFAAPLAAGAVSCARSPHRGLDTAVRPMSVAEFHASRRYMDLEYARVAYVERGAGPVAVFCHGYFLNGYQWRGALDRLSAHRRCIAPDFLGLGYSEAPASADLSPHAQAAMLASLLDALGVAHVDLIASDSGGTVAQIFVAEHPTRVRTLLLTNCEANQDSPPRAVRKFVDLAHDGKQTEACIVPWQADHGFARSPDQLGGAYTYPAVTLTDELLDCYLAPLVQTPLRRRQADQYLAAADPNPLLAIEPALRAWAGAVRIVWGTGDTVMDPASPDWLARTFPGARGVRRVPGAKLLFPEELPEVIADEARRLWSIAR
jgi:pimeloyl-ACP methyl ester carboxylesterase